MKPIALIVEDDSNVASHWRNSLQKLDMESRWATNLKDALLLAKKIPPPSLILLDLNLEGGTTAIDTINAISELKTYSPEAVIIIISGFITPEITTLAIEKGAHGVRQKMDMQRSRDLWSEIETARSKAPINAQKALSYTSEIIRSLTNALKLL